MQTGAGRRVGVAPGAHRLSLLTASTLSGKEANQGNELRGRGREDEDEVGFLRRQRDELLTYESGE